MPADRTLRATLIATWALLGLAILAGAFVLGGRMRGDSARASAEAPPAITSDDVPAAHGTQPWTALTGGECLDRAVSPWQAEFRVVPCTRPHTGQLTRRVALKDVRWPGRAALVARLSLTCADDETIDVDAAKVLGVRTAYSWPTAQQWGEGDHTAYCFVFRGLKVPFTGSVTAAG